MKNSQLSFLLLCLLVIASSCSRKYDLQFAGRYKPHTDVTTTKSQPSSPADDALEAQTNDVIETNVATTESNDAAITERSPDGESTFQLTEKQQKKAERLIAKAEKIIQKQAPELESLISGNLDIPSELTLPQQENERGMFKKDDETVLLVILAIFLPPLAVYLYEDEITAHFWIDLLLTLLFWLPGVIYAWIIILGD